MEVAPPGSGVGARRAGRPPDRGHHCALVPPSLQDGPGRGGYVAVAPVRLRQPPGRPGVPPSRPLPGVC
eukprot:7046826-Alexandrium_andersonii.AAC.1